MSEAPDTAHAFPDTSLPSSLWDVIVVGAGPAGSVTAGELARLGCRVLVVDRATFPRNKVCGCCLNGATIATLHHLGLGHVLAGGIPLNKVCLAAGRRSAAITLPPGMALSREVFDARLVDAAVRRGAVFCPNTLVRPGTDAPERREVMLNGVAAQAKVVVVASGLAGNEASAEPGSRIGLGATLSSEQVAEFYRPGTIYMATSRHGYAGMVRVEGDRLDIAAAIDPAFVRVVGGPGPAVAAMVNEIGWPAGEFEAAGWKGTPALTRQPIRIAGDRWFAAGDAAGYVEPFTGEGMAWAVMGAAALAPLATRAVRGWEPSLASEWERAHRQLLRGRQRRCRLVARVLRHPALCRMAVAALSGFPVLARPVTAALNRPTRLPPTAPA